MNTETKWMQARLAKQSIDDNVKNIREAQVVLGTLLLELREQYASDIEFGHACFDHDIELSRQKLSALRWYAALDDDYRAKLHAEHPNALLATSLRDHSCGTHGVRTEYLHQFDRGAPEIEVTGAPVTDEQHELQSESGDSPGVQPPSTAVDVPAAVRCEPEVGHNAVFRSLPQAATLQRYFALNSRGVKHESDERKAVAAMLASRAGADVLGRFASMIEAGALPVSVMLPAHHTPRAGWSARLVAPALPPDFARSRPHWSRDGSKRSHVADFGKLLDDVPDLLALQQALVAAPCYRAVRRGAPPKAMEAFCVKWWRDNVEARTRVTPSAEAVKASDERLLAKLAAAGVVMHPAEPRQGKVLHSADACEQEIIVYGDRIWPLHPLQREAWPDVTFTMVWSLAMLWQDIDRQFGVYEPRATERGAWGRPLRKWLDTMYPHTWMGDLWHMMWNAAWKNPTGVTRIPPKQLQIAKSG